MQFRDHKRKLVGGRCERPLSFCWTVIRLDHLLTSLEITEQISLMQFFPCEFNEPVTSKLEF